MAMDITRPLEPIILEPMVQQPRLLGLEDDWTGVTNSAERRRVQNRLNQRALRKRKQKEKRGYSGLSKSPGDLPSSDSSEVEIQRPSNPPSQVNDLWDLFDSGARNLDRQKLCRVATICKLGAIEQQKAILEFEKWVRYCQKMGSPRNDHLLVLVKFNVFRAIMSNGSDLGYAPGEGMDDDDALSPFSDPSKSAIVLPVPAALQPTRLQRQIAHHPWIDTIPIPGMRDNLLRAGDTYDDTELCSDLVGFCNRSTGRTGMILWGEPWDANSWEMTEDFMRYWGWTVRGCKQLLQATNYWRQRRGEEPLHFDRGIVEDVSD